MIRSFQWDLARQVERLDWLLPQLPRYAEWGYQELHLHLEDAVEYPSLPGVARRDAYTYKQFARLVDAATRAGINVVPIVNLLGHTQYLIKVPALRDLNELRAPDGSPLARGQICPLHPRTLEIAEKLLRDMAPFCTAGKVHVGLDESFHLGRHPLSRREIARIGLAAHFVRYVKRLHALTGSLGLRLGLWADMLALIPDAIPLLPRNLIAYDWYYYPFRRLPRIEMFNFRDYDLATPLQAHGIEYWGCPMNGSFRHEPLPIFRDRLDNLQSWWRRCAQVGAGGMLVTSWEPNRLALEMTTVVDAAAASLWLDSPSLDHTGMLAKGFERALGVDRASAGSLARRALRCDQHAFAGYARWEMNDRWDVTSPRETIARYARGERFFRRLAAQKLPAPFAASAAFLHYLHARDVFIRRAARGVFRLRASFARNRGIAKGCATLLREADTFAETLSNGRNAARAMWLRTREPRAKIPNALVLAADATRLRAWQRWLRRCLRSPDLVLRPAPVVGRWQLQLAIRNVAPALQKIVIEQQQPDSTWRELRSRFTIEFSSLAAAPRSNVERELSVSVEALTDLPPILRIAVRGLGQVKISNVELSDGLVALRPKNWSRGHVKILGRPAPREGLPAMDWATNTASLSLSFEK